MCNVTVKPEWFKDGIQIRPSGRITIDFDGKQSILIIKKPTTDDQGTYLCIAKNEYGEAKSTTNVIIEKQVTKPEIVTEMKEAVGVQGGEARFEVRFDGHPKPKVEWFHGSDKLTNRGRFSIIEKDGLYILVIKDVIPTDSGVYKCVATNEGGKRTLQSSLTVKEPQIALQFEQVDVRPKQQEVTLTSSIETKQKRPTEEIQFTLGTRRETETLPVKPVTLVTDDTMPFVLGKEQEITMTTTLDIKSKPKQQEFQQEFKGDVKVEPIVGKEQQFTLSTGLEVKPKHVSEGMEFTISGKPVKEEVRISPIAVGKEQEVKLTTTASLDTMPRPTTSTEFIIPGKHMEEAMITPKARHSTEQIEFTIPGKHMEETMITPKARHSTEQIEFTIPGKQIGEAMITPKTKEEVQLSPLLVDKKQVVTIDAKSTPFEEIGFTIPVTPKAKPQSEKPVEEDVITPKAKEVVQIAPLVVDQKQEVTLTTGVETKPLPVKEEIGVTVIQDSKTEPIIKPKVEEPQVAPKFEEEQETEPLVFDAGNDVTLTTTVNTKPQPDVSWYKGDKRLRETKDIQLKSVGNTYTLTIKDSNKDDSGNYRCEAKNDYGTSFKAFDVNVQGTTHCQFSVLFNYVANKTKCQNLEYILIMLNKVCHLTFFLYVLIGKYISLKSFFYIFSAKTKKATASYH